MPDANKKNLDFSPQPEIKYNPSFPTAKELGGTDIEHSLNQSHEAIEAHTSQATGQLVAPGSSIPVVNSHPLEILNPTPVAGPNVADKVEEITPSTFKRDRGPKILHQIFKLFGGVGKDLGQTYEQHMNNQSYRTAEGSDFQKQVQAKNQSGNPLERLKKPA